MIRRILKVDVDRAIELFEATRWKFWEKISETIICVEVRRLDELLVIELPNERKIIKTLEENGFIEQERSRVEW